MNGSSVQPHMKLVDRRVSISLHSSTLHSLLLAVFPPRVHLRLFAQPQELICCQRTFTKSVKRTTHSFCLIQSALRLSTSKAAQQFGKDGPSENSRGYVSEEAAQLVADDCASAQNVHLMAENKILSFPRAVATYRGCRSE